MIQLPLMLALAQPVPEKLLLSCDDFDWLVEGVMSSELLTPYQKVEFISRFAHGTDPSCFNTSIGE